MRALVADDDGLSRQLVCHTVAASGYEVDCAENGEEAVRLFQEREHQIVITDWQMPIMSGLDVCRAVRHHGGSGYSYVILLTGNNGTRERIEGLSAGADDFISKPFEPDELLARLQTAERIISLETRDVAIFAMAKLAESRDPETGAHLERVQGYCRLLAQQLAAMGIFTDLIDTEFVRLLHSTSPLHDIGKVGIPDSVLLKPGRLSDAEFEIMKSHTTIGAQTLEAALERFPNTRFLKMARNIAASHHERFDGTGYPNGLAGGDIPLCGRILAVADVYDALTNKRVYKPDFSHEVARSIMLKEAGTHFDPQIIEAFAACDASFKAVRDRYRDALALAA